MCASIFCALHKKLALEIIVCSKDYPEGIKCLLKMVKTSGNATPFGVEQPFKSSFSINMRPL